MDLAKIYLDYFGNKCNILNMVKRHPEWAANRIQEGEMAIDKLTKRERQVNKMKINIALTIFENKIYERLKQEKFIRWNNTLPIETRALNRLFKKGLVVPCLDNEGYKGWKII